MVDHGQKGPVQLGSGTQLSGTRLFGAPLSGPDYPGPNCTGATIRGPICLGPDGVRLWQHCWSQAESCKDATGGKAASPPAELSLSAIKNFHFLGQLFDKKQMYLIQCTILSNNQHWRAMPGELGSMFICCLVLDVELTAEASITTVSFELFNPGLPFLSCWLLLSWCLLFSWCSILLLSLWCWRFCSLSRDQWTWLDLLPISTISVSITLELDLCKECFEARGLLAARPSSKSLLKYAGPVTSSCPCSCSE